MPFRGACSVYAASVRVRRYDREMDEFWVGVVSTIVLGVVASALWALIARISRGLSGNPIAWRLTRDEGFDWELERVGRTTARAVQITGTFHLPGEFGPGVYTGPHTFDMARGSKVPAKDLDPAGVYSIFWVQRGRWRGVALPIKTRADVVEIRRKDERAIDTLDMWPPREPKRGLTARLRAFLA